MTNDFPTSQELLLKTGRPSSLIWNPRAFDSGVDVSGFGETKIEESWAPHQDATILIMGFDRGITNGSVQTTLNPSIHSTMLGRCNAGWFPCLAKERLATRNRLLDSGEVGSRREISLLCICSGAQHWIQSPALPLTSNMRRLCWVRWKN